MGAYSESHCVKIARGRILGKSFLFLLYSGQQAWLRVVERDCGRACGEEGGLVQAQAEARLSPHLLCTNTRRYQLSSHRHKTIPRHHLDLPHAGVAPRV